MTRPPLLKPGEAYTFSKYYELSFDPEDILAEFGCSLERSLLNLSRYSGDLDCSALKQRLEQSLTYVDLTSEAARREVLIAPILLELCRYTNAKLKIEYPIVVSELLKGSLDYYLQTTHNLLVVEANNADLSRGFTQLAVELIALDQWATLEHPILYGAVTTADIWKFGLLYRQDRRIVQDINLYRVPADLEDLMRMLIAILDPTSGSISLY
jgi:hypothetical protein